MEVIKSKKLKNMKYFIFNYNSKELLVKVINNKTKKVIESIIFKSSRVEEEIDAELNRLIIKTM